MDGLREAVEALQSEAGSYPFAVRVWMRTMAISFFSGAVFMPWKSGARWVVSFMVVTAAGLIFGKVFFPGLSREAIGASIHLALWPILLFVLWRPSSRRERREPAERRFDDVYHAWLVWVSVLMTISLVLDARAVLLHSI